MKVIALVADDRGAPDHRQQPEQRQRGLAGRGIGSGEHTGGEQQGVARQEWEEHHTRFDKYDEEDEARVGATPMAIQPAIAARGSFSSSRMKLTKPMCFL